MNLKKIIDYAHALRDFEDIKSDPQRNVGTGNHLYSKELDFKEVLRSFEISPSDVTKSPLVEVYRSEHDTTPNLYLNQTTAEDRIKGSIGRSRLLRIPPVQATAEFTLLGASIRFRTFDLFVEFDPKVGDYNLCIVAPKENDQNYINSSTPGGLLSYIQNGKWRAT